MRYFDYLNGDGNGTFSILITESFSKLYCNVNVNIYTCLEFKIKLYISQNKLEEIPTILY